MVGNACLAVLGRVFGIVVAGCVAGWVVFGHQALLKVPHSLVCSLLLTETSHMAACI